jgi:membrane protein
MRSIRKFLALFFSSLLDLLRLRAIYHSSALTYSFLLSMAPLSLLILSFASFLPFFDPSELKENIERLFPEYTEAIVGEVMKVRERVAGTSAVSLLIAYLFGVNFVRNLNIAVKEITEGRMGLQRGYLIWFLLPLYLISGSLVLTISFTVSVYLKTRLSNLPGIAFELLNLIPGTLILLLIYSGFRGRNFGIGPLLTASITVAVLISAFQLPFTWYLSTLYRGNVLYGSMSSLLLFLIWINSVFFLLLLGFRLIWRLGNR